MPEPQIRESRLFERSSRMRKRVMHRPLRGVRFLESKRVRPVIPQVPDGQQVRAQEPEPPIDTSAHPPSPPRAVMLVRYVGIGDRDVSTEIQVGVEPANLNIIPVIHAEPLPLSEEEELARDFEVYAPDLPDALRELYEVQSEARSDGGIVPDDDAVARAKRTLMDMYRISPRLYTVYPMDDGQIAIDAATKYGTSLVVLCNPDGSAQCLTYIGEEYRTKEYPDTGMLPDDFIRKALVDSTPLTDS